MKARISWLDYELVLFLICFIVGLAIYSMRYVRGVTDFLACGRVCGLNHLVLTSEAQLRYVVHHFLEYYNRERPQSSLVGRIIKPWVQLQDGEIMEFSRLGGLLKSYRRVKPKHDETAEEDVESTG